MPKFKKIQTLTDNLNNVTRENLTGVRVVRAYNAEAYQEKKFDFANAELSGNYLFVGRVMSIMNPIMNVIMSGMSLAIYWIGAVLIKDAEIMLRPALYGDMTSFMISTFSDLVLRVALSFILAPYMGFMGICLSYPIGWAGGMAVSLAFYLRGKWKTKIKV